MRLCKFSWPLFLFLMINEGYSYFSGTDCLKSTFNIEVSHKGQPFGLLKNKLRVDKKDCVLIVEKEKYRFFRSRWELDVCRFPIHIKEGAGAIDVFKKTVPICKLKGENQGPFCHSLKKLKGVIQDYGLIFATGEKENISSNHGKIYCSFLLINFYFDENKVFGLQGDQKTNRIFRDIFKDDVIPKENAPLDKKSIPTEEINIKLENSEEKKDEVPEKEESSDTNADKF